MSETHSKYILVVASLLTGNKLKTQEKNSSFVNLFSQNLTANNPSSLNKGTVAVDFVFAVFVLVFCYCMICLLLCFMLLSLLFFGCDCGCRCVCGC